MASFAQTSFVDAAACGDLAEVSSLLSSSATLTAAMINCVDKDGKSAFHYACLNDDARLLTILLSDPRVDVQLTSRNGDTGLHMAALYSSLEALRLLQADGRVDLDKRNKYGETALHLCAGSGDKSAAKTAALLLSMGASLAVGDKWNRGPSDVSHDNAENSIVATFAEFLIDRTRCSQEMADAVETMSAKYKSTGTRSIEPAAGPQAEMDVQASKANAKSLMSQMLGGGGGGAGGLLGLGGVKLKKTSTVLKTMFKTEEGAVKAPEEGGNAKARAAPLDPRRALSKMIDFPGDLDEIRRNIEDKEGCNPAGCDFYGLTALHKFASWNKTDYLSLLLPVLSRDDLEAKCPQGKTALHYAVEMASVAAVLELVKAGANLDARDAKGKTVKDILNEAGNSGVIDRLKVAIGV